MDKGEDQWEEEEENRSMVRQDQAKNLCSVKYRL